MTELKLETKSYLGIDVGKCDLYVHLKSYSAEHVRKQSKVYPNTTKGVLDLILWVSKTTTIQETYACLEHTGHYGKLLIQAFETSPICAFYVVNPYQIKCFARQKLRRNKSDKADAKLITQFLEQEQPYLHPWNQTNKHKEALKELSRYYDELTQQVARLKTRIQATQQPIIIKSVKKRIKQLEAEKEMTTKEMQKCIKKEAELKQQAELLESIPGIGAISVPILLAELPDLNSFRSARDLAAWAGVTPRHYQSGTSGRVKTPITKVGSPRIRKALFFPAISAMKFNPILKTFAQRLREKGKQPKQIVLAVERKLLHLIYGILKNNTPFNPEHLNNN